MILDMTDLFKKRSLEYCPFCGTELKQWSKLTVERRGTAEQKTKMICNNCRLMLTLDISGDIEILTGTIYNADDWSMGLEMAPQTAIDALEMDNDDNLESKVDYLRNHRTPKIYGDHNET